MKTHGQDLGFIVHTYKLVCWTGRYPSNPIIISYGCNPRPWYQGMKEINILWKVLQELRFVTDSRCLSVETHCSAVLTYRYWCSCYFLNANHPASSIFKRILHTPLEWPGPNSIEPLISLNSPKQKKWRFRGSACQPKLLFLIRAKQIVKYQSWHVGTALQCGL